MIEFDWTISLGSLLAGVGVVCGIFAATWRMSAMVAAARQDVEVLKIDMSSVKAEVHRIGVMQQQLVDGKERMDRLEDRLERLEGQKR